MGYIEKRRKEMIEEFLASWFIAGGFPSSDTYKRTMWSVDEELSASDAAYHLTMRKGLPEPGAKDRLIMAGHEWLLRQWFLKPLRKKDIELAVEWYSKNSWVKAFPQKLFGSMIDSAHRDEIFLSIDIWGFPGGQTFLAGVPCMSFEGPGGLVSFIEPQMCRYYGSIIHATKGRLMYEAAGNRHAEFGYRADPDEKMAIAKLLAIYTGNGGKPVFTSCDAAEFMFPELFRPIGTIGHEFLSSFQSFEKPLEKAELEAMEGFVRGAGSASLLSDLVDAETVGMENAIAVMKKYPNNRRIGIRVDSGDIAGQCVSYYKRMREEGIEGRLMVFEDEVTPEKEKEVYALFKQETGVEPDNILFPGAGGYYYRGFHRDTLSAAFKRSMTRENPNMKFSNSPGKESIPGRIRVYEQDDMLVIADKSEEIDGIPLFEKLVENGKIVNPEDMDFKIQAERANRTWGRYRGFTLSPKITEWKALFDEMKQKAISRTIET
jgi:nicotinic acid phosphoribosyltransferase